MKSKVLCIILARGGSKGIPKKNLHLVNGIPLIAYTICEAVRSQYIGRVIVSSDDDEIIETAKQYGAEAPFKRPIKLATDESNSHDAFRHAVNWVEENGGEQYEYLVELLCTNPMKTAQDIDAALHKLISTGADSVIGVCELDDHHPIRIKKIEDDRILDFCLPEVPGTNRQELKPKAYIRNGSIYACRRDQIDNRVGTKNSRPYIMSPEKSINIDGPLDLILCKELLKRNPRGYMKPVLKAVSEGAPSFPSPKDGIEKRVLITQTPFGEDDPEPLELLKKNNIDYTLNPLKRIPIEDEMKNLVKDYGIILSGTGPLSEEVMDKAPHLKMISRAGIGLDNVDLQAAKKKGIIVTYTPDAPSPAVGEFTIGLMLSLIRHITRSDRAIREKKWTRWAGKLLKNCTVGVIGVGRTGKRVIQHLSSFGPEIIANDLKQDNEFANRNNIAWLSKEEIYKTADIISLHVPLTQLTKNMISKDEFSMMKEDTLLINTSRGGVVDENSLYEALQKKKIGGAAVDVYLNEPYSGPLNQLDNCILTSHMASGAYECRKAMEMGAVEQIIKYINGKPIDGLVPAEEYELRAEE